MTQISVPKPRVDLLTKTIDATPKWLRLLGGRVFVFAVVIVLGVLVYGALGGALSGETRGLIESVFWGVVVATTGKKASGSLGDGLRALRAVRSVTSTTPSPEVEHIDPNAG